MRSDAAPCLLRISAGKDNERVGLAISNEFALTLDVAAFVKLQPGAGHDGEGFALRYGDALGDDVVFVGIKRHVLVDDTTQFNAVFDLEDVLLLNTSEEVVAGDDDFVRQVHAVPGVLVNLDTDGVLRLEGAAGVERPAEVNVVVQHLDGIGGRVFVVWLNANLDVLGMAPQAADGGPDIDHLTGIEATIAIAFAVVNLEGG